MRKSSPNPKSNKSILLLTYGFVLLFGCMIAYFSFFLQMQSEDVINNSYNARLDRFSDRIVRGEILTNDGTVLAETIVTKDGREQRRYSYDSLFSQPVGYSGYHGKTGLESLGNFYLLSSHVNLIERVINQLSDVKNIGDNVVTTLDFDLQKTASDALGDRKGAVMVMEPDTGKILAMVSKPGFNPNTIDDDWSSLISQENTNAQLLNRATQGLYPPGSTFKILTALEYIREHPDDYQNYHFDCDGLYKNGEYKIQCFHGTAHGSQDLTMAFANSCNGAFASMGLDLDLNQLNNISNQLLYNSALPIALPYNQSSFNMKKGAGVWEALQTSIGQGTTQITPIHNLMIISAIANGGTLMKPYLIDHVENVGGQSVKKFMPSAYGSLMTAEESKIMTDLLRAVVTQGTGSAVRTDSYAVAGKTGSAEFETGKESHAWFVGFAPVENPKIAVSVIVEEGGTGGKAAAPIARSIFDNYFAN